MLSFIIFISSIPNSIPICSSSFIWFILFISSSFNLFLLISSSCFFSVILFLLFICLFCFSAVLILLFFLIFPFRFSIGFDIFIYIEKTEGEKLSYIIYIICDSSNITTSCVILGKLSYMSYTVYDKGSIYESRIDHHTSITGKRRRIWGNVTWMLHAEQSCKICYLCTKWGSLEYTPVFHLKHKEFVYKEQGECIMPKLHWKFVLHMYYRRMFIDLSKAPTHF